MKAIARLLAVFALAFAASENSIADDSETGTVSGTVSLNGQPISEGRILFYRRDEFIGSKIKNGKFQISRTDVGAYRVCVEGKGIPEKFAADDKTPLAVQVAAGANVLDFEVK